MAKLRVRLASHEDETSEVCQWLIPEAHPFEHWSDAPAYDGTHHDHSAADCPALRRQIGARNSGGVYGNARRYRTTKWSASTGRRSTRAPISIRGGAIRFTTDLSKDSAPAPVNATAKLIPASAPASAGGSGYELSFHSDPYILDGRYGNNAWLQELPRPDHAADLG